MLAQDQANVLLNLIKYQQPNTDKIYFHTFESKYQLLVSRKEEVGIKHEKNPKEFMEHSRTIVDVHEN